MNKSIICIGTSVELPKLVNVNYTFYNLYKLKAATWRIRFNEIKELITHGEVDGIIFYLHTSLLLQASQKNYSEIFLNFIQQIDSTKSILISYEENLYGNFGFYDYDLKKYIDKNELIARIINDINYDLDQYNEIGELVNKHNLVEYINEGKIIFEYETEKLVHALKRVVDFEERKQEVLNFTNSILESDIDILPFKDKLEIRTRLQTFIFEIIKDVFFTIFVKKDQPLYEEFEAFLKLFEKYIQNIEGISVVAEIESYDNGVTFNFRTKDSNFNFDDLHDAINRFSFFMDLCQTNQEIALDLVMKKVKNVNDALSIIQDLSKKYKRLLLDIQHQRERILLSARQDFENSIESIREKDAFLKLSNIQAVSYQLIDNMGDHITYLSEENYSQEEKDILQLIKDKFDFNTYLETKSNLNKLKNEHLPKDVKSNAVTQIKGKLIKIANKLAIHAETISIKILTSYLEGLIK